MDAKKANDSLTILTDLVLPGETNYLDNLFGGELLARMDRAFSIAARRHSRRIVVTASVNHVAFNKSVPVGSVVILEAKVSRAFNTSMEVRIDVWAENMQQVEGKRYCNSAYYTFVAVDQTGRPIPVLDVTPESEREKEFYESAIRRRELRLVNAGRMKPEDATHLKKIFLP